MKKVKLNTLKCQVDLIYIYINLYLLLCPVVALKNKNKINCN